MKSVPKIAKSVLTSGNFGTIPTILERKNGLKWHKKRLYG